MDTFSSCIFNVAAFEIFEFDTDAFTKSLQVKEIFRTLANAHIRKSDYLVKVPDNLLASRRDYCGSSCE